MVRPAWLVALIVVAFAAQARAASMLPPRMGMYTQQGAPLAMVDSKIVVRVRGPIAEAVVTQTFRNDTERVTEATYIFPLPHDAAVSALEIESGSRTIRAAIESRERAQQRYESAVAAGIGAALLDQERPDVFTQTVSAIPAKGVVKVTLRFDTVARYHDGRWELVLPLVVAPRYVPGSASGRPTTGTGRAPDTDRAPDASRVTPGGAPGAGGRTEIVLELGDAVDDVTSPTHDLAKASGGYSLVDPKSDHDAVIRWRAKAPSAGWVEASDDGGYAAVVVEAPPAATRTGAVRVMLVLDRAATSRGDADAVKRPFVRALLGALTSNDEVALAGTDTLGWRAPDQIARALEERWDRPGGAFDLTRTLQGLKSSGAPIVLVGDGLVADDRAVLAAAAKVGAPIHVIGVGPAPNRSLLAQIAATTGGTVRFLVVGDDPRALAADVLSDVATPPPPLTVTWGTLEAIEVVPATLPRLGAGQAMLVLAKVKHVRAANARVRGDVFGFVTVTPPRAPGGATTTRGPLARRWARMKLDDLVARGTKQQIVEHALRYGLVSPYTSMVAVGTEVVEKGGVRHSVAIPVSVPEGMRWQLVKREIAVDTNTARVQEPARVGSKAADKHEKPMPPPAPPRDSATTPQSAPAPIAEPSGGAPASEAEAAGGYDDDASYAPAPTVAARLSLDLADGEALAFEGVSARRQRRLSLALGAGLAVEQGDTAPVVALAGRFEIGRRAMLGIEAALWLVDGLDAQGSALATVRYRGLHRRLELGAGAGLRVTGDALGPAFTLHLRTPLPVRGLAMFLRYDGALLSYDSTYGGQNTASFGLEASF